MNELPTQPLDYASSSIKSGGRRLLKTVLASCAILGIAANLLFITHTVQRLHDAIWAHHDLKQNHRAFAREVSPETIEALGHPTSLHLAAIAFTAASILGTFLAVNLLLLTWQIDRAPEVAARRATDYLRFKLVGVTMTTATLFWFFREDDLFWQRATRHISVGYMPPFIPAGIVLACGLFPWWWLNKGRVP